MTKSFQLCWKERTSCHLEGHDFRGGLHAILPEGRKSSEFRGMQQLHSSRAENWGSSYISEASIAADLAAKH